MLAWAEAGAAAGMLAGAGIWGPRIKSCSDFERVCHSCGSVPDSEDGRFDAAGAHGGTGKTGGSAILGIFDKIGISGWHFINGVACCGCLVSLLLVGCGRKHAIDLSNFGRF